MQEDSFFEYEERRRLNVVRTLAIIALICALALLAATCAPDAFAGVSLNPHEPSAAGERA
jgi:hypothetical protein